ncbi:MAG: glycoside hydrolase family protein [Caulobacteraceae bacterium]|nr:glycoside hydrolase family protein [Caulobacteraceae bacterium]
MTPALLDDLRRDERPRLTAYQDSRGIWVAGYGHAGAAPGSVWTLADCERQLRDDVAALVADLDARVPGWRGANDVRQDALVALAFVVGVRSLAGHATLAAAIGACDWRGAARLIRESEWALEAGDRLERAAALIERGARLDTGKDQAGGRRGKALGARHHLSRSAPAHPRWNGAENEGQSSKTRGRWPKAHRRPARSSSRTRPASSASPSSSDQAWR